MDEMTELELWTAYCNFHAGNYQAALTSLKTVLKNKQKEKQKGNAQRESEREREREITDTVRQTEVN